MITHSHYGEVVTGTAIFTNGTYAQEIRGPMRIGARNNSNTGWYLRWEPGRDGTTAPTRQIFLRPARVSGTDPVFGIGVEDYPSGGNQATCTIQGVKDPVNNTDAANKQFVVNQINTAITGAINASY